MDTGIIIPFVVACSLLLIIGLSLYTYFSHKNNRKLNSRIQELESVLNRNSDCILLLDKSLVVVAVNAPFASLVGLDHELMLGKSGVTWPDENDPLLYRIDLDENVFTLSNPVEKTDAPILKKNISFPGPPDVYYECNISTVWAQDDISGWLIVLHNVTESNALLQLREDMTHMLVHDLRSPLSVMLGSMETAQAWLAQDRVDELERLFQISRSSGERLLGLLNDLLDIYKLESGDLPLYPEMVPATMLLYEVRMHLLPLAEDAGIVITVQAPADLPFLNVDVGYMSRAIYNLLDNAIKYTQDYGRIHIWARSEKSDQGHHVLIGVTDSGPGIPIEQHRTIFKKFQHDRFHRGRRRGTGLGLPFCKLVVEAHEGKIWVESEGTPKKGSTFVVKLPAAEIAMAEPSVT